MQSGASRRPKYDIDLPNAAVTILFTDIEGSTKLWDAHQEAMGLALARHDLLVRRAIESHGGHVFKTVGDAFHAAFPAASDALAAALEAQIALEAEVWPEPLRIQVRMALHTGEVEGRARTTSGRPSIG